MNELGDKITIQSIDQQTFKPDRAGSFFRIMYTAADDLRHTQFCDTVPKLLGIIENIIKDRMESCKTSKPTELPTTNTQRTPVISS
jgi:hypothetical protein